MQLQYGHFKARLTSLRQDSAHVSGVAFYALQSLWENGKLLTFAFFLLSCIGGLTAVLEVQAITVLINKLTTEFSSRMAAQTGGAIASYIPWVLMLIGALIIKHFVDAAHPWMSAHLNERTGASLKKRCYQKSLAVGLLSFETADYYDKLQPMC
jgi:ABC-type transport system involved in cytochrome bd biosynthesis fused ATPase/permease subunit